MQIKVKTDGSNDEFIQFECSTKKIGKNGILRNAPPNFSFIPYYRLETTSIIFYNLLIGIYI